MYIVYGNHGEDNS